MERAITAVVSIAAFLTVAFAGVLEGVPTDTLLERMLVALLMGLVLGWCLATLGAAAARTAAIKDEERPRETKPEPPLNPPK